MILASRAHLATTKRKPVRFFFAWISRNPDAITAALRQSILALLLDLSSAGFPSRYLTADSEIAEAMSKLSADLKWPPITPRLKARTS